MPDVEYCTRNGLQEKSEQYSIDKDTSTAAKKDDCQYVNPTLIIHNTHNTFTYFRQLVHKSITNWGIAVACTVSVPVNLFSVSCWVTLFVCVFSVFFVCVCVCYANSACWLFSACLSVYVVLCLSVFCVLLCVFAWFCAAPSVPWDSGKCYWLSKQPI